MVWRYLHSQTFSFIVLLILIGSLPFGYLPVLQLGQVAGVHIDISWLYVIAVFAALVSAPLLWRNRRLLWSLTPWRLAGAWLLFMTLSIVWTSNLTRGLITVGFAWLVFVIASVIIVQFPALLREKRVVLRIIGASVAAACLFALWQFIGDAFKLPFTFLPDAYRAGAFDFARPTAFALEPQFFGSLLLAPWCFALYKSLVAKRPIFIVAFIVLTVILALTISRGAFLAVFVAGVVIILTTGSSRSRLRLTGFAVAGFVIALGVLVGVAVTRGETSAYDTLDTTLNQLSVGIIDLPSQSNAPQYVTESSSSRLLMTQVAYTLWSSNPGTMLGGVGVGGFGAAASQQSAGHYPESLVANNYYAEMLAELGLIGVGLFVAFITYLTTSLWRRRQWLVLAVLIGYLVQWCFFSGNANVVHVWVWLGLACALIINRRNPPVSSRHLLQ